MYVYILMCKGFIYIPHHGLVLEMLLIVSVSHLSVLYLVLYSQRLPDNPRMAHRRLCGLSELVMSHCVSVGGSD